MSRATTELGKILRKLRIDREESLGDMADKLKYTSSYLSAIEKGRRPAPSDLANRIAALYSLSADAKKELESAADKTLMSIKVNIGATSDVKRDAALVFARTFDELDEETSKHILKLLEGKQRSEQ